MDAFLLRPGHTIREAMACIDANARGIALVVDREGKLLRTLTDGDLRRALLRGCSLQDSVAQVPVDPVYPSPITAPEGTPVAELQQLMQCRGVQQIPLLDRRGRVKAVARLEDTLVAGEDHPPQAVHAVIMAGGFGTRLRPLTDSLPKPMLPVGDKPLMQRTVEQLRDAGIRRISVTIHFEQDKIVSYFGDGTQFGVEIDYVAEDQPLGTAGALGLLPPGGLPLLVINGDILTQIDYRELLKFHLAEAAVMTVAVRQFQVQVPYGVIEVDGPLVLQIREKPLLPFLVNAGIYVLSPETRDLIPVGRRLDMTELIAALLERGDKVIQFPITAYWKDIGRRGDYADAQADMDAAT